jgi:hypothetical protein
MALPTYKTRGISYADLPRVSTANLEAGADFYGNLNKKIDSLMSYTDKIGKGIREKEAMRDAISMPISSEHLTSASDSTGEVQTIMNALTGNAGNYYQEAFEKAQGSILANDLEIDASNKISQIQAWAELGEKRVGNEVMPYSPDDALADLTDLRDGFSATVKGINFEAGLRLQKSIHITANKAYQEITKKKAADFYAGREINLNKFIAEDQNKLREMFMKSPDQLTPLPDLNRRMTHDEEANLITNKLLASAAQLPGKKASEYIKKIYEARTKALQNSFIERGINNIGGESVSSMLSKIDANDMGAWQKQWDNLNFDQKMEVRKGLIDRTVEATKAKKAAAEAQKSELTRSSYGLMKIVELAGSSPDYPELTPGSRQQLFDAMGNFNSITGEEYFSDVYMRSVLNPEPQTKGIMTANEEAEYKEQIWRGDLDSQGIFDLLRKGKINGVDRLELFERYRVDNPKNVGKAIKTLNDEGVGAMGKQIWNAMWGPKATARMKQLLEDDPQMKATDAANQALQEIIQQKDQQLATVKHNSLLSLIRRGNSLWKEEYSETSAESIVNQMIADEINISDLFKDPTDRRAKDSVRKILLKARELGYIK